MVLQEGETYKIKDKEEYFMVYGTTEVSDGLVVFGLWVDPETLESTRPDEFTVSKKDLKDWEQVDI